MLPIFHIIFLFILNTKISRIILGLALLAGAWYYYTTRLPRYGAGESAPDFSIATETGDSIRLSNFRGKMVMLHFWGAWCPPCRKENPELARLYGMFHDKGLEVISIAIERNPAGWKKAIEKDGINWPMHFMEPGDFSGPVATLFNIHSIPAVFLINPKGQIISANDSPEVMEKLLQEQLN